jgi:hypothetical protein
MTVLHLRSFSDMTVSVSVLIYSADDTATQPSRAQIVKQTHVARGFNFQLHVHASVVHDRITISHCIVHVHSLTVEFFGQEEKYLY